MPAKFLSTGFVRIRRPEWIPRNGDFSRCPHETAYAIELLVPNDPNPNPTIDMPIYEYSCESCGHYQEFLEKIGASALRKCPSCGKRKFKRLVSLTSFHLKGAGWYVTDFRDKDKKKPQESGTTLDSKDSAPKPEKAKGAEAKKGEAKPATDSPKNEGSGKKVGKASAAA